MHRFRALDASADSIGAATLAIGAGLSVIPVRFGRRLGLNGAPRRARAIGLADLALGAAIIASGRWWPGRRWPVLVGREVLHLVIVDEYRRLGNVQGMLAMSGLFVIDGIVTVLMYRTESRSERDSERDARRGDFSG